MSYKKLSDDLSVSAQIHANDIEQIAADGFRSIICNRPDGESPDQPDFATLASIAKQAGLETSYIPISPSGIQEEQAVQFAAALRTLPGPALAYCRSGARSAAIWELQKQLTDNSTHE